MQTARAFRGATLATPTRVTVPRQSVQKVAFRSSRPQQLQSEFLAPVAGLKGLCASFAQMVLGAAQRLVQGARGPLLIECNNKKGLGVTLYGTRRKRARVSGFRARMASVGGRKVLAARRKKQRHSLVPASVPKRKM